MPTSDYAAFRLSTEAIPLSERAMMAREVFGREILNLDLEPDPEIPLHFDFQMRRLPGLKIVTGCAQGVISRRTTSLLADSNDDLFLSLNETNRFLIHHRGHSADLGPGDAVLTSCAEVVSFRRTQGVAMGLCVPRQVFAHLPGLVEDRLGRFIPATNEALTLLRLYVGHIRDDSDLATPELRHLFTTHVHDLLLLAVKGSDAAPDLALGRGLKAARLHAIKTYISQKLPDGDLSITAVAAAHRLSERYVQRMFEADGQTFSTFVSHQRLALAYRMLRDPRHLRHAVSAIAYDCGFGDVSHFNRMFRRLYGAAPSEVRPTNLSRPANDPDDITE